MRDKVVAEAGSFYNNDLEDWGTLHVIRDLVGSRSKSVRNIRKKSIIKKRCNQAKGKKRNALFSTSRMRTDIHFFYEGECNRRHGEIFSHF